MSCERDHSIPLDPDARHRPAPLPSAGFSCPVSRPFTSAGRWGRAPDVYVGARYLAAAQMAGMKPRSPVIALEVTW